MPDEKKNAPPEVEAATEKIELEKKPKPVTPENPPSTTAIDAPNEDTPAEETATQKIAPTPTDEGAVPIAKPTAAPRRIPPRKTTDSPPKAVAAESDPPKPEPKKIAPQQVGPQQVGPQRIGPPPAEPGKTGHKKWWAALVAAVVVIAVVAAGAYLLFDRTSEDDSAEKQIRSTVESFTRALADGDLATLRSTSCGTLATFYRDIPDADFGDVHRISVEQGSIPTLDSIDAIQVTDADTAIAQVIAHTNANPNDRSPRTFDLALDGEQWKVCR